MNTDMNTEMNHIMDSRATAMGAATPRKDKHIEIHEAIQNLDSISHHLDALISRLEGPSPQNEVSKKGPQEPEPTLLDILNGGSNAIRMAADIAHERIDRLSELLF